MSKRQNYCERLNFVRAVWQHAASWWKGKFPSGSSIAVDGRNSSSMMLMSSHQGFSIILYAHYWSELNVGLIREYDRHPIIKGPAGRNIFCRTTDVAECFVEDRCSFIAVELLINPIMLLISCYVSSMCHAWQSTSAVCGLLDLYIRICAWPSACV